MNNRAVTNYNIQLRRLGEACFVAVAIQHEQNRYLADEGKGTMILGVGRVEGHTNSLLPGHVAFNYF